MKKRMNLGKILYIAAVALPVACGLGTALVMEGLGLPITTVIGAGVLGVGLAGTLFAYWVGAE